MTRPMPSGGTLPSPGAHPPRARDLGAEPTEAAPVHVEPDARGAGSRPGGAPGACVALPNGVRPRHRVGRVEDDAEPRREAASGVGRSGGPGRAARWVLRRRDPLGGLAGRGCVPDVRA